MTNPDLEGISWVRILLAFLIVSSLLATLGLGLRYIANNRIKIPGLKYTPRRLSILETLPLDIRRRLVLVKCDESEHLLLLGTHEDVVVATYLPPSPTIVSKPEV